MEGMGHGDGHSMGTTGMSPPPPPPTSVGGHGNGMMMMHMTFFWGKEALVLFPSWPGNAGVGMYLISLLFIFFLAAVAETLTAFSGLIGQAGSSASSAFLLTAIHALRMGVLYLVMLAVMSFNGGVFLATIAGHAIGFFLGRSRFFLRQGTGDVEGHARTNK